MPSRVRDFTVPSGSERRSATFDCDFHVPEEHRRRLHPTNTLERLQGELERRSRVVGIFPDRAALLRLVGMVLAEHDDEWAVTERRYSSRGVDAQARGTRRGCGAARARGDDRVGTWRPEKGWTMAGSPPLDGTRPLHKTEVIRRRGPWRGIDDVEYATLEWVDSFNHRWLLEPIGYVPPAEFEAADHQKEGSREGMGLNEPSLR